MSFVRFSCRQAMLAGVASVALSTIPATARAQDKADETATDEQDDSAEKPADSNNTIIVFGRAERLIGQAGAASEGGVAGADIEIRPLLRPAEILEATPGLIATQHSGGGKANQYFLRGFNLDHGTDFAVYIDDMPMNFRTHGHGQGYLDVNGLIPEAVQRLDYRKGPYRADTGDFGFVGSSYITTRNKMDPFAVVEVGMYDYARFVAGGSLKVGGGDLLFVGQAKYNNGPWDLPEDYDGYSGMLKYSAPLFDGQFQASLNIYSATWAPTEQIPERAIGTLVPDAYGTLDPTLRGSTEREILTVGYKSDTWRITGYLQHYDWNLLSNFTFYLEDPVNGDQLRQYDKRWTYGGRIERTVEVNDALSVRAGTELREDTQPRVGFDETIGGVKEFTVGAFDVKESSAGVYAEAIVRPIDRLMVIGGLRGDWYRFRTTALEGASSWDGVVKDHGVFPKIGVNYEIADGIALYANWGEGFHSNDSRGVTSPTDPAPGVVQGTMKEIGARFERGGLILTGVYWWSYIDSELIYVGDSGAVEPSDPGRRHGYELTAFWKPNSWLALDGVWTGSTARYVGLPDGENYVPGALESAGELGVSSIFPEWNAAIRFRYLGPHPLIEDNSERGEQTLLVNLRAAWTPSQYKGWEIYGEVLNLFDSTAHDIDYVYATRLPGEPLDGIEGRQSRIVEPRQLRIGFKKTF
ncbi:TonB-dependent receptor [Altererythrobacter sp. Root672]|uniref:TonB-dependent receptor n=1 Tax=Altererythrobacter sp. Root672 TaxID=1736584 RepID=UPI00138F72B5|nr:TonB-dependent receptor [Altererythrobacter sp. Root672]